MAGSKQGPVHQGRRGTYDQHRHWIELTEVLPDEARVMPETVPHEVIATHPAGCRCDPCGRYPAATLRRLRAAARLRA